MMFDLNKEREAFEALPQIKAILIGGEFYFSTLSMNYKPKNPQNENHLQCTYFLNGAWYTWQEKAKDQAVPVWISTDLMKPDEGDLVLGISKTKLAEFNVYQVVALDEFEECEINYWMPLPTAPSESGAQQ
ncbi:hypothetical protein LDY14_18600 [Acinetobacter baumannii]|uniref:hypothetical protein n=1 Tax=Acinetobacter baumannii TaxID=470 RepID=UPI001CDC6E25|nr:MULTISPECIES: hypothetical protein [Acinetobacter calcoaceticus/baumannii complex]MCA4182518.1 hypothetical protein [Acinetobacter baumannii]MDO7216493.1 hypothetical protein [Acinetobacter nosocomialis]